MGRKKAAGGCGWRQCLLTSRHPQNASLHNMVCQSLDFALPLYQQINLFSWPASLCNMDRPASRRQQLPFALHLFDM